MASKGGLSADVVVVGGGVIGLSVAWHLRREGASVILLEGGQVGGQATGAAAGMLAPLAEAKEAGPFVTLGLASLRRYPEFVDALREETGMDAELTGPGMLRTATGEDELEALSREFAWQRALDLPIEWLSGAEVHMREPALSANIEAAVLSTFEKNVEPRRLARALALANVRRKVSILEGTPVFGFEKAGARVTGVHTPGGILSCGQVVIAGGAWTKTIGSWLEANLPIFPVRGQILALSCLPPPLKHTLYTRAGYLVPKADGRVVVGATEDSAGFDARPTAQGMARLLNFAVQQIPSLATAPFENAWAGLRPACVDELPILGPLPGWENAYVATGHFRNGILLAPITGEILAQSLLHDCPHPLLPTFRACRFSSAKASGGSP